MHRLGCKILCHRTMKLRIRPVLERKLGEHVSGNPGSADILFFSPPRRKAGITSSFALILRRREAPSCKGPPHGRSSPPTTLHK